MVWGNMMVLEQIMIVWNTLYVQNTRNFNLIVNSPCFYVLSNSHQEKKGFILALESTLQFKRFREGSA